METYQEKYDTVMINGSVWDLKGSSDVRLNLVIPYYDSEVPDIDRNQGDLETNKQIINVNNLRG